jgi:NTE family protein
MLDGIEVDIERLESANRIVDFVDVAKQGKAGLKKVDYCWVAPSVDIAAIAQKKSSRLPRIIRYMMKTLGSIEEAREIVSYLLFEPEFCTHLIEIGFEDGMNQKEEIKKFLLK